MGRLEQLRISLLDMDPEDVRDRIRFIRADRRITKTAAKMPAAKRQKKADNTLALIKGMTPAQMAKLLKDLQK